MLLPCLSDMLCQVWNPDHFTCFKLSGNLWSYHKFLQVLIHTTKSDFTYGESYQDRSPFSAPFYIFSCVLSREKKCFKLEWKSACVNESVEYICFTQRHLLQYLFTYLWFKKYLIHTSDLTNKLINTVFTVDMDLEWNNKQTNIRHE